MYIRDRRFCIGLLFVMLFSGVVHAGDLARGNPAPDIRAVDTQGRRVSLEDIFTRHPYMLIVYCFKPNTGEELAVTLQRLQNDYGRDKFQVVALGIEHDEAALSDFAGRLGIRYHLVNTENLEDDTWLSSVRQYPLTLFIETIEPGRIDRVLAGEGISSVSLLTDVAETLFRQRREEALAIIEEVVQVADERSVVELHGYILAGDGKLDEAEQEFGSIESFAGLARVALDRGDLDRAVVLAERAGGDPYAISIKAEALALQGKIDEAEAAFEQADIESLDTDWQASEAANSRGRIRHHRGDLDGAIRDYRNAREIDAYGIKPLSNEASAHREQGNLEEAEQLLARAASFSDDSLVALLLQQVREEREAALDLQRQEFIRTQIQSLSERYRELREAGLDTPADTWTTRPLTVALLPGRSSTVFFDRAGVDVALQREIEGRLQADARVQVLERAMLEYLLQELALGASDLADASTQQTLGRVLAARYLGFLEYGRLGSEQTAYLRLVDTETTGVAVQASQSLNAARIPAAAEELSRRVVAELTAEQELKGLVADVADDGVVMINIGARHGVEEGHKFEVITDGEPIEVGGRVIAHRQARVGLIEVTNVDSEYSLAKISIERDGTTIEHGMKVKRRNSSP